MTSRQREAGDLRDLLSHRNSDSTVQEDMGGAHRNGQLCG